MFTRSFRVPTYRIVFLEVVWTHASDTPEIFIISDKVTLGYKSKTYVICKLNGAGIVCDDSYNWATCNHLFSLLFKHSSGGPSRPPPPKRLASDFDRCNTSNSHLAWKFLILLLIADYDAYIEGYFANGTCFCSEGVTGDIASIAWLVSQMTRFLKPASFLTGRL